MLFNSPPPTLPPHFTLSSLYFWHLQENKGRKGLMYSVLWTCTCFPSPFSSTSISRLVMILIILSTDFYQAIYSISIDYQYDVKKEHASYKSASNWMFRKGTVHCFNVPKFQIPIGLKNVPVDRKPISSTARYPTNRCPLLRSLVCLK